jgi:hypothetical protein
MYMPEFVMNKEKRIKFYLIVHNILDRKWMHFRIIWKLSFTN